MLPRSSLEAVFERDLDQLPLPDPDRWVPREKRDLVPVAAVAALAIFVLVGIVTVAGLGASSVLASPPIRPTSSGGRLIGPLPNEYRNAEFGYNVTVPAWLRVSTLPPANATAKGLLHSERFTGRNADEERAFAATAAGMAIPSWDLVIEVWQRDALSAGQWAVQRDGCVAGCALGSTAIHGTNAVTAVWSESAGTTVHAFYFERGPNILVLRYAVGSEADRPQDVTPELLDQVVRSIGLV